MFCKNCGSQMNSNQAICLNCGCAAGTGTRFCANCGNELNAYAQICTKCGVAANFGSTAPKTVIADEDIATGGMKFLAFLIPIAGIIIGITEKDTHPQKAKTLLKISIITWIVSSIIIGISYSIILA